MAKRITPLDQVTQKMVKEAFDYDEDLGNLTWAIDRGQARKGQSVGYIKDGYRIVRYGSRDYPVHRVIWLWMTGSWPSKVIDHIDRNRLNNRFSNLRDVTQKENSENMSFSRANTSGSRGIYKQNGGYVVKIYFIDKLLSFGKWDSMEDAELVYRAGREALGMAQTPEHNGMEPVLL